MPAWAPPVNPKDVVGTGHKWLEPVDQEGVHKGVDLQLTKGKPALSPVDGVVTDVGNDPEGLGITVTIRDAQGTETKLGHLDGVHVKKGDQVKQGQQVADVGETGASTGPHLDVRMQDKAGQFQDPTALLGPLAQMPRADKPGPVGAGQEDEQGNPYGWAAAVQDPYAAMESRWQHSMGMMPPTMQNPQIPDEQRFWGGPQPQDQLQQLLQLLQRMGPEAAMGWQGLLYGPQGPLAPFGETAVGGGQDRVHVGTLYRAGGDSGVGVGQGQGGFASPLPSGGIYGAQKWSSPMGSNAVDIFVRRGTPVSAPVSGTIQQGMNGQLILAGDNGWNFAFRHGMTTAQGHVQEGQQIGIVNDPGLDSLGRAPWGNMPDNYQHLEMSVSRGSPNFPGTPGGGGNVDAAQFLNQIGYQGQEIPKTPGPPDAQGGGGMGFGGGQFGGGQFGGGQFGGGQFGGGQFGGGGPGGPMSMLGGMGMPPGMGMGMGFPGMPGGMGMPGGGQGMMPGMPGMGMPGMPPGMSMNMGMTSPMGMGMPSSMGMFGDPSAGGGLGGMDPGMGMSTGMGSMDPMIMGAGPMGDFSGWGGQGGGTMDPSSLLGQFGMGGFGQGGMGGFGGSQLGGQGMGMGGQQGFGGMGQQGMGMGAQGGLGSQMQAPAFSGYPGAMPSSPLFGGPQGNPVTSGPADQLMLQNLQFKPDWTGVNDAQATLKKNATTPLTPFPINTNQLPAAPKSNLDPWQWLNQIYPGSGQDRAPVGSGQDRPGWATPSGTRGWAVGVGADATTTALGSQLGTNTGATPTNTPFTGTLTTDPAQAVSGNLNQQYFQLAQQQLQQQIQQVNQSFQAQQQQLAQQASQFGMTTQLAQQQQQLQQQQFDANQKLQRQLAELQNAQLQQNLGIQTQQFNQQMGLQGAQLGMQGQQFNQQMGLQGAQLGLQQQQLGMLPQQLAAQYGLSAAQLGQGQQQLGVQVQQLNQQYQQAQQAAYQQYLTSGNQDQLQRDMANLNAKFQQAQAQIQQAQYGGTMQLNQQQLRGQTGLSLAQMAQQQQQAGYDRQMQVFNSAMSEPWLQQLSGMSQQWGAPGGPQEAGQASAQGMPNMPSQGGGINLPNLNQYFPDINVQQYLQGQTPQVGGSPFQPWQQAMQGLGQYNPYGQSPINLPENPNPFQVPNFQLGQNPYPFNFSPVQSTFNFQPTSVPLEGQMPWANNPIDSTTQPPNNTTGTPNTSGYQAGPLTFTGQGSMTAPPTGYTGGGVTYTLPNQQQFGSQDVWNWEQGNPGGPDAAYQFEMGSHGFPGWNFPVGPQGGFPVGSTVGWNMGPAAAGGTTPTPLASPAGSGQDRVGSGQGDMGFVGDAALDPSQVQDWRGANNPWAVWLQDLLPLLRGSGQFGGGPVRGDLPSPPAAYDSIGGGARSVGYPWGPNWDIMNNPVRPQTGGAYVDNPMDQRPYPLYDETGGGQDVGSGQGAFGFGETNPYAGGMNTGLTSGDPTSWGMGPVSQWGGGLSDWNTGVTGTPDPWSFGSPQQGTSGGLMTNDFMNTAGQGSTGPGGWGTIDPYAGWGTAGQGSPRMLQGAPNQPSATPDPTSGGVVDSSLPPGGNTTGDAWQQYQQALGQWQQQNQAYQQYQGAYSQWQPQEAAYQQAQQAQTNQQDAYNQYYGNWQQNYGPQANSGNPYDLNKDSVVDVRDLGTWQQQHPTLPGGTNPGAAPTAVTAPGTMPTAPQMPNPLTDFPSWITSQGHPPYTPPTAPTMPTYEQFSSMDPFQQAGLRTQAQLSGIAWPQYQNMLRQNWGSGGITAPPVQSPLTMSNLANNTLNNMSFQNLLSVFGQTPQQYQTTYSPYWSQAQVPQVSGMMGGGY